MGGTRINSSMRGSPGRKTLPGLNRNIRELAMFGRSTAMNFVRDFHMFLQQPDQIAVDSTSIMTLFHGIVFSLFALLGPVLGLIALIGLVERKRKRSAMPIADQ